MISYLYYPGCSLSGTAREYDLSVRVLMKALGAGLVEIDDWTCCGATAAQAVDSGLSLALAARNLALAGETKEKWQDLSPDDILVPCSACYLNLKTARTEMMEDKSSLTYAARVLEREGLRPDTAIGVRHLLDVLALDADFRGGTSCTLSVNMTVSLAGMTVAPYYGCQCLRPFKVFDDPEDPHSMDAMIRATGASVLPWDMGGQCCGASQVTTHPESGRKLAGKILDAAMQADCIVTVCPMCQMNLEICQEPKHPLPVLYLPQLLGLSMGLAPAALGLHLNLTDNRRLTGE